MKRSEKKLGEILVGKGVLTMAQLEVALAEQKLTKEFLGAIAVKMGYVKEHDLVKALAAQFSLPVLVTKEMYIDWELVKQFSPSRILQDKCFPVTREEFVIIIAIENPLDVWALKRAEDECRGAIPRFALVSPSDMEDLIKRYNQYMRGIIFGKLE
jgi:type IV pilus assembly protein PilB